MVELKTFQDLVLYEHLTDAQINEARQEAFKWIKELKETPEDYVQLDNEQCFKIGFEHQQEKVAVIEWIKHFFNITDEELK